MVKISTITCHDVYNYGASLQAYALQEFCKSLGHEYQIIDYKPPYLSNHYNLSVVANSVYDKPLIKQLYLLAKLPGRLRGMKRKRLFDDFTTTYLSLSGKRYRSLEELKDDTPESDIYIAGSDQIWNTLFKNGRDPAFYLDFVDRNKRKISYAASFATEKIHNGASDFVREKLKNFDVISVRESSALYLLNSLGQNSGLLVCDPVFLLSKQDWLSLARDIKPIQNYILVYDCERCPKLGQFAKMLKHSTGLPICSISDISGHFADKDLSLSGPLEFLSIFANADFVVANSFHALAFSLIFHKNFYITLRSEGINTRLQDFLKYLGLEDRLVTNVNSVREEYIHWEEVDRKLHALVENSKQFLIEQFNQVSSR